MRLVKILDSKAAIRIVKSNLYNIHKALPTILSDISYTLPRGSIDSSPSTQRSSTSQMAVHPRSSSRPKTASPTDLHRTPTRLLAACPTLTLQYSSHRYGRVLLRRRHGSAIVSQTCAAAR